MQGVVGDNADGLNIRQLFALFELIHHLRGKNMRADDRVGRIAGEYLGKLGCAERVDDIDDAGRRGKIACAVVFRQLVDQTVQRLHVLGRKQIAFVDRGFDQIADIGVHIQRVHFSAAAGQQVADGLGRCMVSVTRGHG